MTPDQKRRAERLISLFENDTLEPQYGYIENLDDGRGFTAGRAGFTSATGDLLDVVERYSNSDPGNPLSRYVPRLRELAKDEDGDTDGLDGFETAWKQAAEDPACRAAQDAVVDETYYDPALKWAQKAGLQTALSEAVLYDTCIQHGEGDDPDGLPALVNRTHADGEEAWLRAFLAERRRVLQHATDPDTREVWKESVGRCDVWSQILDAGNWDLNGPIRVDTDDWRVTVP